ncbi:MAG: hypothetical protein ABL949_01075 [Fimbriimonadaceae bacterium]
MKPLGFLRLSDRSWAYDGGWWLLHLYFGPSSGGGSHTELGVQPLIDWHSHITLGCVDAPRRWSGFRDAVQFEAALNKQLDELLPIALSLITEVTTPAQMLSCPRIKIDGLRLGLLQALAGDISAARMTLGSLKSRPGIEHERVTTRHAEIALGLIEDHRRFNDFVELLILRSRLSIGGDIGSNPPLTFPWMDHR